MHGIVSFRSILVRVLITGKVQLKPDQSSLTGLYFRSRSLRYTGAVPFSTLEPISYGKPVEVEEKPSAGASHKSGSTIQNRCRWFIRNTAKTLQCISIVQLINK